jgi:AraC-like DNA-binding protein
MLELAGLSSFARRPVGKAVAGRGFAVFCATPRLAGLVLWGRLEKADVEQNFAALQALAELRGVSFLLDARRLSQAVPDAEAFARAAELFEERKEELFRPVRALALVLAPGMQSQMIAGMLHLARQSRVKLRAFENVAAALRWLAPGAEGLEEELAGLGDGSSLLPLLRALLDARSGKPSLQEAARALGHSPRSLQRRLAEEGKSFRGEREAARIRAARELLRHGEAKIAAVAAEVGFASAQHFSARFRAVTGMSPREFRRRGPQ